MLDESMAEGKPSVGDEETFGEHSKLDDEEFRALGRYVHLRHHS
jgi:hypothetical protein